MTTYQQVKLFSKDAGSDVITFETEEEYLEWLTTTRK